MDSHDFDDILVQLGMGRWNMVYIITAAYSVFLTPSQYINGVYMVPSLDYTCVVPEDLENVTTVSEDSCYYTQNTTELEERVKCSSWKFDDSIFSSTITSEFQLVCDQEYQRANYQGMYLFGTLFGQYIGGYLAGKYGRKIVILVTHLFVAITSIGMIFLQDLTTILAFRFINGAMYLLMPYVLAMEVCPPKYRGLVGVLAGLPWALGTVFWGALAYFIRDWRYLQLAASLPTFLIFIPIFIMDESPRWLIVKGRHHSALKGLEKASKWNKSTLPPKDELLQLMVSIEKQTVTSKLKQKEERGDFSKESRCRNVEKPKLFSTRAISIITSILCFTFFALSLVFDGLNLSGDIYSADPFLYIIIGGLVEVPGYSLTAPLIDRVGRKNPTVVCFIFCGLVILAAIFIPTWINWLVMTLVMLGKMFISAAYQIVYVYTTELFPTEVRSQGIGLACFCQQIGSVLSPYITTYIGPLVPWIPAVIFSGISMIGGLLLLMLRETRNTPLPDTVADLDKATAKKIQREYIQTDLNDEKPGAL